MLDRHCKSENLNEKNKTFLSFMRGKEGKKKRKKYQMVTHYQIRL